MYLDVNIVVLVLPLCCTSPTSFLVKSRAVAISCWWCCCCCRSSSCCCSRRTLCCCRCSCPSCHCRLPVLFQKNSREDPGLGFEVNPDQDKSSEFALLAYSFRTFFVIVEYFWAIYSPDCSMGTGIRATLCIPCFFVFVIFR